jgi:Uma2 family endonuclease
VIADNAAWLGEPDLDQQYFSEAEYLTTEETRLERHEYIDGSIRAMAAASENHEEVAAELLMLIRQHLKGRPCRVFKGDLKLRAESKHKHRQVVFYYPDIMVVCDPTDTEPNYKSRPKVIIEVLSRDKGRDLIEKLEVYREIETVEEYFVVSQNPERPEVYTFRRRSNFEPDIIQNGSFTIESIGLSLDVKQIYDF